MYMYGCCICEREGEGEGEGEVLLEHPTEGLRKEGTLQNERTVMSQLKESMKLVYELQLREFLCAYPFDLISIGCESQYGTPYFILRLLNHAWNIYWWNETENFQCFLEIKKWGHRYLFSWTEMES
jgi:hypothetical protein